VGGAPPGVSDVPFEVAIESTIMTKPVPLSEKWAAYLVALPETGMGYQVVSVTLNDGRRFEQVVVDSGYITRVRDYRDIPFAESEIAEIKITHDKWNWKEDIRD